MSQKIFILTILFFGLNAFSKTKEFCGKREGTSGDALLVDNKGNEVILFSYQGGRQALLEQADKLVEKILE